MVSSKVGIPMALTFLVLISAAILLYVPIEDPAIKNDINAIEKTVVETDEIKQETIDRVNKVVDQYKTNPDIDLNFLDIGDSPYVFVVDYKTEAILAYPDETKLGKVTPTFHNSNISFKQIISELEENGQVWIQYDWIDYDTNILGEKNSWLTLHDGLIFGSGYITTSENLGTPSEQAQLRVNEILRISTFYPDLPVNEIDVGSNPYVFVVDVETKEILAHGYQSRVGQVTDAFNTAEESYDEIFSGLEENGYFWMHYEWEHPETKEIKQKTSWLKLHDGKIFGSGFIN